MLRRLLSSRSVAAACTAAGACAAPSLYERASCKAAPEPARPVCVVVGVGQGGIGEHTAQKFSDEGYSVAMLARRQENLNAIEAQIANSKGFCCDVSDTKQINATVEAILTQYGAIDVLIVNTSGGAFKSFDATTHFETAITDVMGMHKRITGADLVLTDGPQQ